MIWKNIKGFPYQVSDTGLVRRSVSGMGTRVGTIIRGHALLTGHRYVDLYRAGVGTRFYVHRLVAFAFLGNSPSEKHEIDHKDGDPTNNHVSNLRWVTRKENIQGAIRRGTFKFLVPKRGEEHPTSILTEQEVKSIRSDFSCGMSKRVVAEKYNVSRSCVRDIKKRATWRHVM